MFINGIFICTHHRAFVRSVSVESVFARGNERWNGSDQYGRTVSPVHSPFKQSLEISSQSKDAVYFIAPGKRIIFVIDTRTIFKNSIAARVYNR